MSGKEFLGPGVRNVVEATEDSTRTLDLKTVNPGDVVIVKATKEDDPRDILDFTIIESAKDKIECVDDSAKAWLPAWKWDKDFKEEKVKILIGGSATYNPGAPLGFTMLAMGKLTVGRNLVMWLDETSMLFKTPIQEIKVNP